MQSRAQHYREGYIAEEMHEREWYLSGHRHEKRLIKEERAYGQACRRVKEKGTEHRKDGVIPDCSFAVFEKVRRAKSDYSISYCRDPSP